MKVHVIIVSYGYNCYLPFLIKSLEWQSDMDFQVVIVSDQVQISSHLKIHSIYPNEPFSRSSWRNIGLHHQTIGSTDVCLFVDADMILAPDYIEATKRAHLQSDVLISYGKRSDLEKDTSLELNNISVEWFTRYTSENRLWCLYWIRSCFVAVKAGHLREIGGFPEYMVGWGSEDKAIHIGILEGLGGDYIIQNSSALHQYHPDNTDLEADAHNFLRFLSHREKLINENRWFLTDAKKNRLGSRGEWLLQQMDLPGAGTQIIGTNLLRCQNYLVSSMHGNWDQPFEGTCKLEQVDWYEAKVIFSCELNRKGEKRYFQKLLEHLGDPPTIVALDEVSFQPFRSEKNLAPSIQETTPRKPTLTQDIS